MEKNVKLVLETQDGGCNGCCFITSATTGTIKCTNPEKRECIYCDSIYVRTDGKEDSTELMSKSLIGAKL